jgi:hypothetical protein
MSAMLVHTAEQFVPSLSCLEVEIAIAKLKSDQILAELIQTRGETLLRSINPFILFGNCLISGRSPFD